MKRFPLFATIIILILSLSFSACTGPEGAPGRDGTSPDVTSPYIQLTSPSPGDTILNGILEYAADAQDAGGIAKVRFFIDGTHWENSTTMMDDSFTTRQQPVMRHSIYY